MKATLLLLLAAVTLVAASKVKLVDGIVPKKLPPIQLTEEVLPEVSWEDLKDIVLTKGELKEGFIEADVTAYVLTLLSNIQKLIINQGLDPLELAEQKIKLIPVGSIDLYNGWLEELASITVFDKVIAKYSTSSKILELTIPIAFKSLLITYDYHTQIVLLGITGNIDAKISGFKLNLLMGFNFSNYHAFVNKADIRNSGSIEIKFTGLGLLDWVIDLMDGILMTLFHGLILTIVDIIIQNPVNSLVNSINHLIDEFLHPNSTSFLAY